MEDNLLREMQDDLRRDRAQRLWKRYGGMILGLCAAVVIGTAAGVAWRNHQAGKHEALTSELARALQKDKEREALSLVMKHAGHGPHAGIAGLQLAARELKDGGGKEALAAYQQVAEDASQEEAFRNLARVLAVHAALQYGLEVPAFSAPQSGEAFVAEMHEAKGWDLMAQGKQDEALARFAELKDNPEAPPQLRARMEAVTSYLATDAPRERPAP